MSGKKDINYLSISAINMAEAVRDTCQLLDNDVLCMVVNGQPSDTTFLRIGQINQVAEARIIMVLEGNATFSLDLESFRAEQGHVVIGPADTIAELQDFSNDLRAIIFVIKEELDITDNVVLKTSPTEFDQLLRLSYLTWDVAHETPFRKEVVLLLIRAIVGNIRCMNEARQQANADRVSDRQQQLFQDFKRLVNLHCERERTIPFYAEQLGITPHHLSAVIKQISGQSVMYWVNRAIILRAKVLLNVPAMMTYEVADRLNFSSASAFHNFFKRNTGMTPKAYQQSAD